jgi:hypothetical protein
LTNTSPYQFCRLSPLQEGGVCIMRCFNASLRFATASNTMRRSAQIGFLGPAFFLTQLGKVHSPFAAVACMMASQGLDAFSQSGLYSNHQVLSLYSVLAAHVLSCTPAAWCLDMALLASAFPGTSLA